MKILVRSAGIVLALTAGAIACTSSIEDASDVKLVGGEPAKEGQFPAAVALGIGKCTASVIDSEWLVTAAHCVIDGKVEAFGKYSRGGGLYDGVVIEIAAGPELDTKFEAVVEGVYVHKEGLDFVENLFEISEANDYHKYADLALIHFKGKLPPEVKPVSIAKKGVAVGDSIAIAGYGCEEHEDASSDDISMFPRYKYSPTRVMSLLERSILAERNDLKGKYHSGCPGDSGGGMYSWDLEKDAPLALVGVNSWGILLDEVDGDVEKTVSLGAVNLSQFSDWIDDVREGRAAADRVEAMNCGRGEVLGASDPICPAGLVWECRKFGNSGQGFERCVAE